MACRDTDGERSRAILPWRLLALRRLVRWRGMRPVAPNGKGGRRFRQPPVSPDFRPRACHGGRARLHVGGMLGPRRQGLRASRPGQGAASAAHRPVPRRQAVRRFPASGRPPEGRSPGRARSRGTGYPPRCPCSASALRHRLRGFGHRSPSVPKDHRVSMSSPGPCCSEGQSYSVRLAGRLDACRSTVRPDNPLHLCPKAPVSAFWSPGLSMLRVSISALAARLSHAEASERRFGHRIRFVSIPPALASGTGRFPGWRPRIAIRGFPRAPARVDPL